MKYSDDIIEDIRAGNDIIDIIGERVSLKQRGSSYVGLCPFHRESTPSFSVSPDKQLYHCFGCGASGTVYNFVMNTQNYDFIDTIKYLAKRINYTLPTINNKDYDKEAKLKQDLYEIHKLVARKYYDNLSTKEGEYAKKYLDDRNILPNIQIKYGLGYSLLQKDEIYSFLTKLGFNEYTILKSGLVIKSSYGSFFDRFSGRVMFPIIDSIGRVIAFGGRKLYKNDKLAKYLNSPDTPIFNKSANLYSINYAKNAKNKELILVEGYMDAVALYQVGVKNVVASLGTAFNKNHTSLFKRYANKAILLFDSDDAGINATKKAIPILLQNGIYARVCTLYGAKDPDEYIKKYGQKALLKALAKSKSYILFEIEQELKNYNIKEPVEKVEFIKQASNIISKLPNATEREIFIKEVAKMTNIDEKYISKDIKTLIEDDTSFSNKKIKKFYKDDKSKINEARKSIINIMINKNIYNKIKQYIQPREFLDDVYIRLANIIYEKNENGQDIYPANLAIKFEDKKEQEKVSKIFLTQDEQENVKNREKWELEKMINDQIKIIKEAYFEKLMKDNIENDAINEIIKQKKAFEKIYITI